MALCGSHASPGRRDRRLPSRRPHVDGWLLCPLAQGHAADVFEAYSQLLTEMVLRLPYQIKKIADANSRIPPPVFDHCWFYFLSEVTGATSALSCPLSCTCHLFIYQ